MFTKTTEIQLKKANSYNHRLSTLLASSPSQIGRCLRLIGLLWCSCLGIGGGIRFDLSVRWLLTQRLNFYPHGGLRTLRVLYGHNKLSVFGLPDLFKRHCTFNVHGDMIHTCFELLFFTWTCLSNCVLLSQRHWTTKRENNQRFFPAKSPKMHIQVRLSNVQRSWSRNLTLYIYIYIFFFWERYIIFKCKSSWTIKIKTLTSKEGKIQSKESKEGV